MRPVVAIVCDTNTVGPHQFHQAGDKYVQALRRVSDVTPVLIPAFTENAVSADEVLSFADGILVTGGYSNIERQRYGLAPAPDGEHEDPARDGNTLSLIPALIEAGLPMLGICRGLQELNVAFGGTLHPRVHEVEGRADHREDKTAPLEVQYGPAHSITTTSGGLLEDITGEISFMVNSVHGQAIDKLADNLLVEALAEDSTIEAVSIKDAKTFTLAVQWHPEWKAWDNPQSTKIFRAFGHAVRAHKNERTN